MAKNRQRVVPEIDMGPFSDIAFLLIIFFIITTSLVRPMGRSIDMPASENAPESAENKHTTISLTGEQILYGRDEDHQADISHAKLRDELMTLNLKSLPGKQRMIVVNMAPDVTYSLFYKVSTAINRAGGVVTIMEEEEGAE